jgi:transposase
MAYRYGDRQQTQLFPPSIEDYIAQGDPVRAYDAFVEALDFSELGIVLNPHQVGNSPYDPKAMLKLLVYGYSYGARSSRRLEQATYHNLSFIWLVGGLKPDHKTIAEFRRQHKAALKNVLKQCARLCIQLDLIDGNTLFVDGSKLRGNAAIGHTWTPERCDRHLQKIDARIESILNECERVDEREKAGPSLVQLQNELRSHDALKTKVENILRELRTTGAKSLNTTDADCVKVKSRQGTHAGYNGQIVVDEKHGLIVHGDVVNESNDAKQFANQIEQAHETLERQCLHACGDAGYANTSELKKIDAQGVAVIVPTSKQAHGKAVKAFDKSRFHYDAANDRYLCPQGQSLPPAYVCRDKGHRVYQIEDKALCASCAHFGECTKAKAGRRIRCLAESLRGQFACLRIRRREIAGRDKNAIPPPRRVADEETRLKLESQYKESGSQAIYRLRKQKAELPFGHIKRNLGAGHFLLRGLAGVRAEMALLASCFNLARMIGILGVSTLISRLMG